MNSEKKIRVLWITIEAPCINVSHAGGQTIRYYYNQFKKCEKVELSLIFAEDGIQDEAVRKDLVDVNYKSFNKNASKLKKIINVESILNIWNRHAGFLSNFYAKEILRATRRYKEENYYPDAIILEATGIVLLAKEIKAIFPDAKLIASEHDVTFVGWSRKATYFNGIKKLIWLEKYRVLKSKEIASLLECDLVLPHNPDNCKLLEDEGIDPKKIMALTPYFHDMSTIQRKSNQRDILFFGAMDRMENNLSAIWFIKNVMPIISSKNFRFIVLGNHPSEELKLYASHNKNVIITGFVEDINPYFEKAMCFVAPLVLGAGIKVKVLEALSSGVPVLTNNIGIEGIHAQDGEEYFHCEKPEEYANVIFDIANGLIDTKTVGRKARDFMLTEYSPQKSAKRYIEKIIRLGEKL